MGAQAGRLVEKGPVDQFAEIPAADAGRDAGEQPRVPEQADRRGRTVENAVRAAPPPRFVGQAFDTHDRRNVAAPGEFAREVWRRGLAVCENLEITVGETVEQRQQGVP